MKPTIVNLVTPHLMKIVDLANQAETGANIQWHLRDTVANTVNALAHQYNARDLVTSYIQGLEAAAIDTGRAHSPFARTLKEAAAQATRELDRF